METRSGRQFVTHLRRVLNDADDGRTGRTAGAPANTLGLGNVIGIFALAVCVPLAARQMGRMDKDNGRYQLPTALVL